ncbi:MAG: G-protein coupled receptor [Gammaproteobacteria bacterium]|nr:G-protein coupled receptor [Gammaproteobacteria bacterium]
MTHFLLPFLLLLSLNCHVVWTILQARRNRASISSAQKREHRTSIMMIAMILIFVLCNTLPLVLNFLENFIYPDFFRNQNTFLIAYSLNDLSNLLIALNSATNFLIYSIFIQRYRKYLMRAFNPCLPTNWQVKMTSFNSTIRRTTSTVVHRRRSSMAQQLGYSAFRQSIRATLSAGYGSTTSQESPSIRRLYSLSPTQREVRQSIRTTFSIESGSTTSMDSSGLLRTYSLSPAQKEARSYRSCSMRIEEETVQPAFDPRE